MERINFDAENPNSGLTNFRKWGHNLSVSTALEPVTSIGVYRTPNSATSLEIVSDDTNDTAAGSGARKVIVVGLDSLGVEINEEVIMNGTTAVALSNQFIRVYRLYVSESGTYANQTTPSHAGTITVREAGAGQSWAEIGEAAGFMVSQSQIAVYTVPLGKKLLVEKVHITVEGSKAVDVFFFLRKGILKTTAPFDAMRLIDEFDQLSGVANFDNTPIEVEQLTDIGFMAKTATGTSGLSIGFSGVLMNM